MPAVTRLPFNLNAWFDSADAVLDLSMSAFTTDGTLDDASLKLLTEQTPADAKMPSVPVA